MSLIDELRDVAHLIPPSHIPTTSELLGVVGALLTRLDVGAEKFKAAAEQGQEGISELFAPPEEPAPAAAAASPSAAAPAPSDDEPAEASALADAQATIAQLRSELAAQIGVAQRTAPEPPAASPPPEAAV